MPTSEPILEKTDWKTILIIIGAGIVAAFQIGKVPPLLPSLMNDLDFNLFIAGWIISSFSVLGSLIPPLAGSISDSFGTKKMIIIGLSFVALGSFAGSFSTGYKFLIFTRLIEGLGYISISVSAPSLILRLTAAKDIRMVFGVWGSFMPVGSSIMMLASPTLSSYLGWRGLWQLNTIIAILFIFLFIYKTKHIECSPSDTYFSITNIRADIILVLKAKIPFILSLCFLTYAMMFLAVVGFLPTMFIKGNNLAPWLAALLSAIALLMNAPGNILGGILLKRGFKRWKLLGFSSLAMGILSISIYSSNLPLSIRFISIMLFMLIGGIIPATALEGAVATAPEKRLIGTSNGLLMQGAQIGLLSGPPLLGIFISISGSWSYAPIFIGTISITGFLIASLLRHTEKT